MSTGLWPLVLGHQEQKQRLLAATKSGRLASTFLFVGPSGVGKASLAKALAQNLICDSTEQGLACGTCPSCIRVRKDSSESLKVVRPQGANIKIDQAREVIHFLSLKQMGRSRVIIVDEAHKFNPQTANALLKSLEEPPDNTYFILVANNLSSILPTVRSRSQVVRFGPLPREILQKLSGKNDWVLDVAQGSLDAIELFSDPDKVEFRAAAAQSWQRLLEGDIHQALEGMRDYFRDRELCMLGSLYFQQFIRDARVAKSGNDGLLHRDLVDLSSELSKFPNEVLDELGTKALGLESQIAANQDKSLCYETFFYQSRDLLGV